MRIVKVLINLITKKTCKRNYGKYIQWHDENILAALMCNVEVKAKKYNKGCQAFNANGKRDRIYQAIFINRSRIEI